MTATGLALPKNATLTATSFTAPDELTEKAWARMGEQFGAMERSVGWWVGDWWNAGLRFGESRRSRVVKQPDWTGPTYQTCRDAGSVAAKFPLSRRHDNLPFTHHAEVAKLSDDLADSILVTVRQKVLATGKLEPSRHLRQQVKAIKREQRREELAPAIEASRAALDGSKLYRVICIDPPWAFEPWDDVTGGDRSAENHYPTMSLDEISAIKIPAAEDCVIFCWATAPMLLEALDALNDWGFEYRSQAVWTKTRMGTGYWFRNQHEILLLGVKGNMEAPPPDRRLSSVFSGHTLGHSVKPAAAYELIEEMYPHERPLEMFARGPRLGWDVWGAEAPLADSFDSDGAEQNRHIMQAATAGEARAS